MQAFAEFLGEGDGVAALGLSGIEQPVAFSPAEIKRGDSPRLCAQFFDEGDDRESVALHAFQFDPALLSPGAVRRILPLGDDAFQMHPAGMLKDALSLIVEVIDIAEG